MAADRFDHSGTFLSIRSVYTHLDELVMVQGLFDFRQHVLREPGIADDDHGFERMAKAAQMTFVLFGEFHGRGSS